MPGRPWHRPCQTAGRCAGLPETRGRPARCTDNCGSGRCSRDFPASPPLCGRRGYCTRTLLRDRPGSSHIGRGGCACCIVHCPPGGRCRSMPHYLSICWGFDRADVFSRSFPPLSSGAARAWAVPAFCLIKSTRSRLQLRVLFLMNIEF